LLCDGSAVSRATYAKLFAITSTTYGVGDGSTTFNIPDLRGRTIVSVDGSANRNTHANADTLGGVGGVETLTTAQLSSHEHQQQGGDASGDIFPSFLHSASGTSLIHWTSDNADATATDLGAMNTLSAGSGAAHQHPFIALNYIIFAGV
jgi:microcystin-dependent protein